MAYKDINEKRAKAREYYYKNKDRISARNKSYYQKPEVKAKKKAYIDVYRKTPQAIAKRRAWRQKNKEIIRVKKAEWVQKNKEHLKEYNRKRMSDPKIVARKKETTRKWIEDNREHVRAQAREYKFNKAYGINVDTYLLMIKEQGNICFLCEKEFESNFKEVGKIYPCIDHCHLTGKIRKLLCSNCNTALGLIKENKKTLKNMIKYIVQHNEKRRSI